MVTINLKYIKSLHPCSKGLNNYIKHHLSFEGNFEQFLMLEEIPYDDKIWVAVRTLDVSIFKQWSVDCAEFVLENYEKQYPNDNRIRDCIEKTKLYLEGKITKEELLIAARSAAWSAAESAARSAAESAARSAAWSAESAAWSAARSAAWSAESAARSAAWSAAWSAAESAAWSAAESAARSAAWSAEKQQEDINISLLIALLKD